VRGGTFYKKVPPRILCFWVLLESTNHPVQRISLHGYFAGVRDQVDHLFLGDGGGDAGGLDDEFFGQHATHVVGAHGEGELGEFEAFGQPAGLDVGDVIEVDAADGDDLEVVDAGGLGQMSELGVGRREGPGDEGHEVLAFVLGGTDDVQVFDLFG